MCSDDFSTVCRVFSTDGDAVGIDVGAEYFLGYFGVEIYILHSILQNLFRGQISSFV